MNDRDHGDEDDDAHWCCGRRWNFRARRLPITGTPVDAAQCLRCGIVLVRAFIAPPMTSITITGIVSI